MASRRGQALFHAHGLGQAVRVSRETNQQTRGRAENSPPPLGEVACHGKPERAGTLFPAHSLGKPGRVSRETNR